MANNTSLFENISTDFLNKSQHDFPDWRVLAPEMRMVDRIISPIWYVIGIIGNPITARVWLGRKMRKNNSSAIYVGYLAIVHLIFLFFHFIMELHLAWDLTTYNKPVGCEVFNILLMAPQYLAPLLVLAFTVERYIAVCHPFKKEIFCTVKRAVYVSAVLTIFCVCLASVQGYTWAYYDKPFDSCLVRPGVEKFEKPWTLITETIIFLGVPLAVLVFNIIVLREIRRLTSEGPVVLHGQSSNGNITSTITLLSVSFYFICTLLPASVVYTLQSMLPYPDAEMSLEEMAVDPLWKNYLRYLLIRKIVEEISLSNYACYVFIYIISGKYFRKEVKDLLGIVKCRKLFRKRANSASSPRASPSRKSEYTLVSSNGKSHMDCASTKI